jgi:hypothetical protein
VTEQGERVRLAETVAGGSLRGQRQPGLRTGLAMVAEFQVVAARTVRAWPARRR